LPVLNWSEGRASDVARTLLGGFADYRQKFAKNRFKAFVGVHRLQIDAAQKQIDFIGTDVVMNGAHFSPGESEGGTEVFDTIIFATGFGWERTNKFKTPSYWRNEQLAQPNLTVDRSRYLVSGFGDGALIDVCRLTIERFRQDTILYELFGSELERTEDAMRQDLDGFASDANLLTYFRHIESTLLVAPKVSLRNRLRKDTAVTLHIAGSEKEAPKDLIDIFGPTSSVLNRLLIYLLYRCGAISIDRRPLAQAISGAHVTPDHVLCRHGCDTKSHLEHIFKDYAKIEPVFENMKKNQAQHPKRRWAPGYFPAC
jgi:hypothetical protein